MEKIFISLFVTYDKYNIPQNACCIPEYPVSVNNTSIEFRNYMDYERTDALRGEFVPDVRLCRYDFDKALLGPEQEQKESLITNPLALEAFIDENHLKPVCDFSLRRYDALIFAAADQMENRNNESLQREIESFEGLKYYMNPASVLSDEVKEVMKQYQEYLRDCDPSEGKKRVDAIETGQGTLLFPFKSPLAHHFLQYVADRFFTPEARQIGYVRMYPLERPTEEQTRIAARSGYMFSLRDKTFLPEKAIWNLPIVLPEKETPGCTYPLRPTYDAFRYFIQDNDLTVSVENDQVFNLVFIAEMGCPAHFQTDEQYDRFIHRADFLALDDRLEKARRENPSNETLFFRIQNRQQILARDILRGKYNIEIPELKLTGPPAPERQRHRENVRVKPSKNPKPGLK